MQPYDWLWRPDFGVILRAIAVEYLGVRSHFSHPQAPIHPQGTIYAQEYEQGQFAANAQTEDIGRALTGSALPHPHQQNGLGAVIF